MDNRKTVRKYSDYTPTRQEIERIINSARLAPSANNGQNWEFIAIYNQEIKDKMSNAVERMYDVILERVEGSENISYARGHSSFFNKAPVVIAIVQTPRDAFMQGVVEAAGFTPEEIKFMRPDSQLLSMGGAIENMSLAAHALGLSSCWMVAPMIAYKDFGEILNLGENDKIVSLLTIGKPVPSDVRAPKKSISEVMKIIY